MCAAMPPGTSIHVSGSCWVDALCQPTNRHLTQRTEPCASLSLIWRACRPQVWTPQGTVVRHAGPVGSCPLDARPGAPSRSQLLLLFKKGDWLATRIFERNWARQLANVSGLQVHTATHADAHCLPRIALLSYHCAFGYHCNVRPLAADDSFGKVFNSSTLRIVVNGEPLPIKRSAGRTRYDLGVESVGPAPYWTRQCNQNDQTTHMLMPFLLTSLMQVEGADSRALLEPANFDCAAERRRKSGFAAYAVSHCGGPRPGWYQLLERYLQSLLGPTGAIHHLSKRCSAGSAAPIPAKPRSKEDTFLHTIRRAFSRYRFSLVFEKENLPGYMTEKLAHARVARSVPVWLGTSEVRRWVYPSAFVDCSPRQQGGDGGRKEGTEEALMRCAKEVAYLEGNQTAWEAMVGGPFWVEHEGEPSPLTPYMRTIVSLAGLSTKAMPGMLLTGAGVDHCDQEFRTRAPPSWV